LQTQRFGVELVRTLFNTRLPSNLRQTTRECVHLVTRGHFLSRDKAGGHTIRSAIAENHMLHVNSTALSFIEPDLLSIKVLHGRNTNYALICSCDLDLDPMIFIYELDPYPLKMYSQTKNKRCTLRLSKVIVLQSDKHVSTDTHTYIHTYRQTGRHIDSMPPKTLQRPKLQ